MEQTIQAIFSILVLLTISLGGFYFWQKEKLLRRLENQEIERQKQQEEMSHRMYELAILKELGERIGYSLNIEKIVDIIIGSLNQFLDYGAVSYMLLEPEEIIFKIHLEKSVTREFIDEVRGRMLKSLSALIDKDLKKNQVNEILSGAILIEGVSVPVKSFFNIPLVIGEKVVGVLTVASPIIGRYQEEEMTMLYKIIKQASEAISRLQDVVATEEGKLNAMVESMYEGVVMTDNDYRVVVANPAAKKVINHPTDNNVTIFNYIDFLGGKFDIRGKLEESVKLNKALSINEVLIGERFYKILISPVISRTKMMEDQVLGGVVIFHDMTHEKEVEKLRDDFTSMMVHELRSPLDGIKKISKLLNESYVKKDKKAYREFVNLIHSDSSTMLEMVNDLLDVAKLEAGKFSIIKESADIKNVINERVDYFKIMTKENQIQLNLNYFELLPDKLDFDPKQISHVLTNLIGNALKFTKVSGIINVDVFIHHKGNNINQEIKGFGGQWLPMAEKFNLADFRDCLVVGVTDNGVGIAEKNIDRLFNKFMQFRATAESDEKKGTGLGLVIAKGIIDAHQGRIGVGSDDGVGTTFYFALPLK